MENEENINAGEPTEQAAESAPVETPPAEPVIVIPAESAPAAAPPQSANVRRLRAVDPKAVAAES